MRRGWWWRSVTGMASTIGIIVLVTVGPLAIIIWLVTRP